MKYWLVPEKGNPENIVKIGSTQAPKDYIVRLPDKLAKEDPAWLDVTTETVDDGTLEPIERTVVKLNEDRKARILNEREQEYQAREAARQARETKRVDLIEKLKNAKPQGPLKDLIDLILLERGEG